MTTTQVAEESRREGLEKSRKVIITRKCVQFFVSTQNTMHCPSAWNVAAYINESVQNVRSRLSEGARIGLFYRLPTRVGNTHTGIKCTAWAMDFKVATVLRYI